MNYLLICLLLLTVMANPLLAKEESTDQTTATLGNTFLEPLTNEMRNPPANAEKPQPEVTKPRNKWDFSDRPEDKAKKNQDADKKKSKDKYEKRPQTKSKEKWINKDSKSTTESLTTQNTRTITRKNK